MFSFSFSTALSIDLLIESIESSKVLISESKEAILILFDLLISFKILFKILITSKLNNLSSNNCFSSFVREIKFLKSLIDIDIKDLKVSISIPIYFSIFSSTFALPALSLITPFSIKSKTDGDIPLRISTSVPLATNLTLFNSSPLILFGSDDNLCHFFDLPLFTLP